MCEIILSMIEPKFDKSQLEELAKKCPFADVGIFREHGKGLTCSSPDADSANALMVLCGCVRGTSGGVFYETGIGNAYVDAKSAKYLDSCKLNPERKK